MHAEGLHFSAFHCIGELCTCELSFIIICCAVPVQVRNLSLTVVDSGFQCLFEGRNVILTCDIFGFPRPEIVFKRENMNVLPGMVGFERIINISFDQVCD